jgi:hypothetical protein
MPDLAANRRLVSVIAWTMLIVAVLLAVWGAKLFGLAAFLVFVVFFILTDVSGNLRRWAKTEESIDVLPFSGKQLELNEPKDGDK